jgi:hypothetical protein
MTEAQRKQNLHWVAEQRGEGDPFAGANLPRNQDVMKETADTRKVRKLKSIAKDPNGGALVTFDEGGVEVTEHYDQIVVSSGQDASAKGPPPGVAELLFPKPRHEDAPRGKLSTIEGIDPATGERDGNILGLQMGDSRGGIRLVGASATPPELKRNIAPSEDQERYDDLMNERSAGLMPNQDMSPNTRGVKPGIETWEDSYRTLNDPSAKLTQPRDPYKPNNAS